MRVEKDFFESMGILLAFLVGIIPVMAIPVANGTLDGTGYVAVVMALVIGMIGYGAYLRRQGEIGAFREAIDVLETSLKEAFVLGVISFGIILAVIVGTASIEFLMQVVPDKAGELLILKRTICGGAGLVGMMGFIYWYLRACENIVSSRKRELPAQETLIFPSVEDAVRTLQKQGATVIHKTRAGDVYLVDKDILDEHGWVVLWRIRPYFSVAKVSHTLLPPEVIKTLHEVI